MKAHSIALAVGSVVGAIFFAIVAPAVLPFAAFILGMTWLVQRFVNWMSRKSKHQVRRREIATMARLGMPRKRLAAVLGCEVGAVLAAGVVLAIGIAFVVSRLGESAVRFVVELSS